MTLADLFSTTGRKIVDYLLDAALVVRSPRRFLWKVSSETSHDILIRIGAFATIFALFEMLVILLFGKPSWEISATSVAAMTLMELSFSLCFLPGLVLIAHRLRVEKPFLTALTYAVVCRIVILFFPLLLHIIFTLTEDYAFAILKGIAVYICVVIYVFTFGLAVARTRRQRIEAIAASLGLYVLTNILPLLLLGALPHGPSTPRDEHPRWSLLYDPIGPEVDHLVEAFPNTVSGRNPLRLVRQAMDVAAKDTANPAAIAELEELMTAWPEDGARVRELWASERIRIKSYSDSSRFAKTQYFANLMAEELDSATVTADALDRILEQQTPRTYVRFTESFSHTNVVASRGRAEYRAYVDFRRKLARWGLLL